MEQHPPESEYTNTSLPPGTVVLEARGNALSTNSEIILHPRPTNDPNDPLNWSKMRKGVNFGLTCVYVLFTFVMLDIFPIGYDSYMNDLGISYEILNDSMATNYVGLAVGCLAFIPLVHKYGRRPFYMLSSVIQLAAAIWSASLNSSAELLVSNLLAGIGGAISEAIVLITVIDLFFVHQHARSNGLFVLMQSIGAFGGPAAAGFIIDSQGWRWMWWWSAIFLGVNCVLVFCFFEETKYIPPLADQEAGSQDAQSVTHQDKKDEASEHLEYITAPSTLEYVPRLNPLSKRLAIITKSDASIRHHFYLPFEMLFTFPAVSYASVTYGLLLAWFSVITSASSYFLLDAPYNFRPSSVGLFMISALVGTFIGIFTGAPLSDRSILWLARRNGGIFEPEMRLWVAFPGILFCTGGILLFGLGLAKGLPWIVLAVGYAIFGCGFAITSDIALTYLTDCYPNILGDALIAVVFVRNGISVMIMFVYTPWIRGLGIQNTFICVAMISLAMMIMPILLLIWGRSSRQRTATKYKRFAMQQPMHRNF